MDRLLTITIRQDTTKDSNINGDVFIPGQLTVVDVRKAGIITRICYSLGHRLKCILRNHECDTTSYDTDVHKDLTVGIPISLEHYTKLLNITSITQTVDGRCASLDFIMSPKQSQFVGGNVSI
jgi:hypothetical protein